MNIKYKILYAVSTAALMLSTALPPLFSQSPEKGFHVDMKNTLPAEQFDISVLMKELVRTVESCVRLDKKTAAAAIPCRILFFQDAGKMSIETITLKNGTVLIYAPPSYSSLRSYGLLKDIASTMLLCRCGIKPLSTDSFPVPDWISTAIVRKTFRKTDKSIIPGIYIYPGMRAMLISGGGRTILSDIMNHPLKPADGEAFNIYAEACELLLEACSSYSSKKDNLFSQMIYLSAEKKCAPEEAFKMSIGTLIIQEQAFLDSSYDHANRNLTENEKIALWSMKELRRGALNYFLPADAAFAEKEFDRALTVSYREKLEGSKEHEGIKKTCRLGELGKKAGAIKDPAILLSELQRDFMQIRNSFPPLLHPPMEKMDKALGYLRAGDANGFEELEKEAENDFRKALLKQKAMEEYLAEIEFSCVPPALLYRRMLNIISERKRGSAYWSAVEKCLDEAHARYER